VAVAVVGLRNDHSQNIGVRVDVDVGVGEVVDTEVVGTEVVDTEAGTEVVGMEGGLDNCNSHIRNGYSWWAERTTQLYSHIDYMACFEHVACALNRYNRWLT
jgi:hypothetical protein